MLVPHILITCKVTPVFETTHALKSSILSEFCHPIENTCPVISTGRQSLERRNLPELPCRSLDYARDDMIAI